MATDPAIQSALQAFFNGPVGVDGVLRFAGLELRFANGGPRREVR